MSEKPPLECKPCTLCGKTPILAVNKPDVYVRLGMKIEIRALHACDKCYEDFLKFRGSKDAGFWFA